MPRLITFRTFIVILFLLTQTGLLCSIANAQSGIESTNIAIENLKKKADSVYGSNHELVNGELYYQSNLYAKGSPFFMSSDWINGTVTINGTTHNNVFLKYNINTDQLILRPTLMDGTSTAIVLNTPFVESFQLADNHFVNAEQFATDEIKTGFVQEIYSGNFRFLATYKVNFVSEYNEKSPYGKYSGITRTYFLDENGKVRKVSSKKTLFDDFPSYKKEIKKHMKKVKFRFKKADSQQWNEMMSFIDSLANTTQP